MDADYPRKWVNFARRLTILLIFSELIIFFIPIEVNITFRIAALGTY